MNLPTPHTDCPNGPPSIPECRALLEVISRIGDKWTVMLVGALSCGPQRFNQLRKQTDGISQRMLTLTLRGLEADGLVSRTVYPTVPPQVEYALTPLGQTLIKPLRVLAEWGRANQQAIQQSRATYARHQK